MLGDFNHTPDVEVCRGRPAAHLAKPGADVVFCPQRPLRLLSACAFAACSSNSTTPAKVDAPPASTVDAAAAAPDSPPVATNSVTGTIGGSAYAAMDGISVVATASGFDFNGMATYVKISDFAGACTKETGSLGVKYGRLFLIGLGVVGADGKSAAATAKGDYTVVSGAPAASTNAAEVFYEADGADCLKASMHQATSGKVTVTRTGDPIEGTFDLTFDNNEHITGTFSTPACAGLDPNRTPTGGC
jgi:hypothetical protein